jgi:hypothetical protein
MINYSLTENTMNPDKKEYIAKVAQIRKTDLDTIIDFMVAEGTGLTRPQALAYHEKLMQVYEYFIVERGSLTTPFFRIQTTMSGIFDNMDDFYESKRHQLNFRLSPGPRLNHLKSKMKVKKVSREELTPNPSLLIDMTGNSINGQISSGNIAKLKGRRLKFDPKDSLQGIFFISREDPNVRIRVNSYSVILPAEIHFLIPQLTAGKYTIEIKAIMRNHVSVRTGVLRSNIVVS